MQTSKADPELEVRVTEATLIAASALWPRFGSTNIGGERATEHSLKFSADVNNIAILQRQCRTLVVLFTRSTPYTICRCFVCPSNMVLYLSYIFPFTVCRVSVD